MDVTDETVSGTREDRHRLHGPEGRRRRRPSGEAPPLPHELGRSGKFWIVMVVYFGSVLIGVVFFQPLGGVFDRFDTLRLRWIASLRSGSLTDVVLLVNLLASRWTIRALRWGTIAALVGFRHWRHLFVFLGSMLAAEIVAYQISVLLGRSRPFGITIIAPWEGYSMPSRPVVGLAASLVGITYALVVPGRPREIAKWIVGGLILALVFARLYLAVDHPTDAVFGAIMGIAIPLVAFRWYTPNDVFPVTYRRGKAAHLDVGGKRGEAIRRAVQDQLGYEILQIKSVGLEGSGGSTPLRLRVGATEANRNDTCSPSCTRRAMSGRTAGTSSDAPSCMGRWRTRPPSSRSAGSSSTRTTRFACSTTRAFPPPSPTAWWRSRRSASA